MTRTVQLGDLVKSQILVDRVDCQEDGSHTSHASDIRSLLQVRDALVLSIHRNSSNSYVPEWQGSILHSQQRLQGRQCPRRPSRNGKRNDKIGIGSTLALILRNRVFRSLRLLFARDLGHLVVAIFPSLPKLPALTDKDRISKNGEVQTRHPDTPALCTQLFVTVKVNGLFFTVRTLTVYE